MRMIAILLLCGCASEAGAVTATVVETRDAAPEVSSKVDADAAPLAIDHRDASTPEVIAEPEPIDAASQEAATAMPDAPRACTKQREKCADSSECCSDSICVPNPPGLPSDICIKRCSVNSDCDTDCCAPVGGGFMACLVIGACQ